MAPDMTIKIRLSMGEKIIDEKLQVNSMERIADVKQRIRQMYNVENSKIRIICCGKLLSDKTSIKDAKIPKNFVVQVSITPHID